MDGSEEFVLIPFSLYTKLIAQTPLDNLPAPKKYKTTKKETSNQNAKSPDWKPFKR